MMWRKLINVGVILGSDDESFFRDDVLIVIGGTGLTVGTIGRSPTGGATLRRLTDGMVQSSKLCAEVIHPLPRPLDSADVGPAEWPKIMDAVYGISIRRNRVEEILREQDGAVRRRGGILLISGSDTVEHLAHIHDLEIVRLGLRERISFFVTHAPVEEKGSDAQRNLAACATILGDPDLPPGVYVPVGKDIHAGSDVTKLFTRPGPGGSYFFSSDVPLGEFVDGGIRWNREKLRVKRETSARMHEEMSSRAKFVRPPKNFGYVEHIVITRRTPIEVYHKALARALQQKNENTQVAIVIQGRSVHWTERDGLIHAVPDFLNEFRLFLDVCHANDVLVYTGSRSVAKRIHMHPKERDALTPSDFQDARLKLLPRRFPYTKARTKLSWLLRYFTPEDAAYFMCCDIAGELLLPRYFSKKFTHFYPTNSPDEGNAMVVAFPGMTAAVLKDAAESLHVVRNLRAPELSIYGFGDGNLPLGEHSVHECLARVIRLPDLPAHLGGIAALIGREEDFGITHVTRKLIRGSASEKNILSIVKGTLNKLSGLQKDILLSHYDFDRRAVFAFVHHWNFHHPRWQISPLPLDADLRSFVLQNFDIFSAEIAKRVIKDLLMLANPMLFELGHAVDRGVRVVMRTQAFQSEADLTLYELGNLAYAVGVVDGKNPPWMRRMFIPNEGQPASL